MAEMVDGGGGRLPQRGCVRQPRVAVWPLPWGAIMRVINPNGVASNKHSRTNTERFSANTAWNGTSGLCGNDITPLGLGIGDIPPRVAALPQPWAMGQNPVGIPASAKQLADVARTALPTKREKRP